MLRQRLLLKPRLLSPHSGFFHQPYVLRNLFVVREGLHGSDPPRAFVVRVHRGAEELWGVRHDCPIKYDSDPVPTTVLW